MKTVSFEGTGASRAPRRWPVLVGGLAVQVVVGAVYGFSALTEPLKRSFPSWSHHDIQVANTLALLFFALAMAPAGWITDRKGPRVTPLLAAGLMALAFGLLATVNDPAHLLRYQLAYGVLYGTAVGMACVSPIGTLVKWFPEKKGLVGGIGISGLGLGSALFIPLADRVLSGGMPIGTFFAWDGAVLVSGLVLGGLLLKSPPAGFAPAGLRTIAHERPQVAEVGPAKMLRAPRFWVLWLMMVGSSTAGLMTIAVVKAAVAEAPTIAASHAALAGSILALCNAFGRIFWGSLSDRLGRELTFAVMLSCQTAAMLLLAPSFQWGAPAVLLLIGFIGLNFGGNFGLFAPTVADLFGSRNVSVNYGLLFTGFGVAGVIGPLVAAWYKDTLGAYAPAFTVAGFLAGGAAILAVLQAIGVARTKVRLRLLDAAPTRYEERSEEVSWTLAAD